MGLSLLPKTRQGKWSFWLMIAFIASVTATGILTKAQEALGGSDGATGISYILSVISMGMTSILASIFGIIAVLRKRERSVIVYLSIPIGLIYIGGLLTILLAMIALGKW